MTAADDTREVLAKVLLSHVAVDVDPFITCLCGDKWMTVTEHTKHTARHIAAHVDAAVAAARDEITVMEDDRDSWVNTTTLANETCERLTKDVEFLQQQWEDACALEREYAGERDTARAEVDRVASLAVSENARYRTARVDRDRLVEAVRRLADEFAGIGVPDHRLRALIAGTDDTTTRGTNQEDV